MGEHLYICGLVQVWLWRSPSVSRPLTRPMAKHGYRIRVVKNANSLHQVLALANPNVNKLKNLHIRATVFLWLYMRTYEIVFRNCTSLQDLHLFSTTSSLDRHASLANYVLMLAFVHFSALSRLRPRLRSKRWGPNNCLCVTHDSKFSQWTFEIRDSIFRVRINITFDLSPVKSYRVQGPFGSIRGAFDSTDVREEPARLCPQLTGYHLEVGTGAIVTEFLANIANPVHLFMLRYEHISSEVIKAILFHNTSMKTVMYFYPTEGFGSEENIALVSDYFHASGHHLQLIQENCAQLEHLNLHFHEMDMDIVEQS